MTYDQVMILREKIARGMPLNEDDWGSDRQIKAENEAFQYAERCGIDVSRFETMRASSEEMLKELARLADEKYQRS